MVDSQRVLAVLARGKSYTQDLVLGTLHSLLRPPALGTMASRAGRGRESGQHCGNQFDREVVGTEGVHPAAQEDALRLHEVRRPA